MRYCFLLISFFIFSLAQAQDEAQLIKSVRAKLDKVNNYKATGKMKIDASFVNAPVSDVQVLYKKPNKFKIRKTNGVSILPKGGFNLNLNSFFLNDNYKAVSAGTKEIKGILTKAVMFIRKTSVTTRDNGSYEMEMDYKKFSAYGLPDKITFTFSTKDYKLPKGISMEYDKGDSKKDAKNKNSKGVVEITYANYEINKGVDNKEFADTK
jgi:hypothetical protein